LFQIYLQNKNYFSNIYTVILIPFCSLLLLNQIPIFSDYSQQNNYITFPKYNFIAVGDWSCNEETKRTIQNIIAMDPELIITTGDHVKNAKSARCWIEMSQPIKEKFRIAVGNHDIEFANIYKQIMDYHQLGNPYYSHDFGNIHFISMSTEHAFEPGSRQYWFIKSDLEKTSNDPKIDWIIVHQHKPLFSTKQDKIVAEELRDIYQLLFQQYGVDLVISSHNQYYERTYPLLYNYESGKEPIIADHSQSEYPPTHGIVFLTVGTAGDELDPVIEHPRFYVVQESEFGFLNIIIENGGKTLVGEFRTNDGYVLDYFKLNTLKNPLNKQGIRPEQIHYSKEIHY
jgi:hypothetical protein